MLFNSYVFVLLFFPLCLAGYFGLNYRKHYTLAQLFLLAMSLWFYGFFNPAYLSIIIVSIILNYGFSMALLSVRSQVLKKLLLAVALCGNVGILFYYKYFDFFMVNVTALIGMDYTLKNILLPLGISFFTFQQLSYIIDSYKGEVPKYNFLQYASFVAYFPQLIAGPIVTHDELVPQFMDETKKRINWDNMSQGLYMFVLGMAKKVLIADTFGLAVNWAFSNVGLLDSTNALIAMMAYTVQIYFDFSGYCDMAIGIARMMNFDLPLNFRSPYKAVTIGDFWSRWHMTLTRFFTKYIYIPLGGSRRGLARTCINTLVVFLISGIWHGANWTFILWGCLHGVCMVTEKCFRTYINKIPRCINWFMTFLFVSVTWVFFRADSIGQAMEFLSRLVSFDFGPINANILAAFELPELVFMLKQIHLGSMAPKLLLAGFFVAAMVLMLGMKNAYEWMGRFKPTLLNMLMISFLLMWCVFSFAGISTFLYFNF